jgi:hypothetical protein
MYVLYIHAQLLRVIHERKEGYKMRTGMERFSLRSETGKGKKEKERKKRIYSNNNNKRGEKPNSRLPF